MLLECPEASGLYHVSSDPISKHDLLLLVRDKLGHAIEIIPDETFCCDRSLDSSRFRAEFNYAPPTWPVMIEELRR
jgi:dTDP-4-dehydrorhamnose reductase